MITVRMIEHSNNLKLSLTYAKYKSDLHFVRRKTTIRYYSNDIETGNTVINENTFNMYTFVHFLML